MLKAINFNIKTWDWKAQSVGAGENKIEIPKLINRIESGYYITRKVKIDLNVYNLYSSSFSCPDLFEFLTHYKLVEQANLDYPVIVNNQGSVIDGRHRICKAILLGKKYIKGIQILDSSII